MAAKPKVTAKPHALSFGKVHVGAVSAPQTVSLSASKGSAVSTASISATGPFGVGGNTCGLTVSTAPGSCSISVTFQPVSAKNPSGSTETGSLTISNGTGKGEEVIKLTGIAFGTAPTPAPTPTSISATEAGSAAVLKGLASSAQTVVDGDKLAAGLLALQVAQTPGLLGAFGGAGEATGDPRSRIAAALIHFETSGLYGDTKAELPRGTCDFTSNPSGDCTPNANALVIKFNDFLHQPHTTTFDWTGQSTGTSSPTVQAHDPANPSVSFELPTRIAFSFTSRASTVISLITDTQWPASTCVTGESLLDAPLRTDATGFVIGMDGVTKIVNVPNASAAFGSAAINLAFSGSASGGGASVSGSVSVPIVGSVERGGACGAADGGSVTSLSVTASASDGAGDSNQISFSADNFVTAPGQGLVSADLSNGQFSPNGGYGTFSGTLDDSNGDGIWGDNVDIDFSDGTKTLEQFQIDEFGAVPN